MANGAGRAEYGGSVRLQRHPRHRQSFRGQSVEVGCERRRALGAEWHTGAQKGRSEVPIWLMAVAEREVHAVARRPIWTTGQSIESIFQTRRLLWGQGLQKAMFSPAARAARRSAGQIWEMRVCLAFPKKVQRKSCLGPRLQPRA